MIGGRGEALMWDFMICTIGLLYFLYLSFFNYTLTFKQTGKFLSQLNKRLSRVHFTWQLLQEEILQWAPEQGPGEGVPHQAQHRVQVRPVQADHERLPWWRLQEDQKKEEETKEEEALKTSQK